MLCEICKKEKATAILHRKDASGEDEELYVCKGCLDKAEGRSTADGTCGDAGGMANVKPKFVMADGEEPPPFIRKFLDAAVGLIEGVAKSEPPEEPRCGVCGSSWKKIKETKSLGCPDCWSCFAKEIRKEFLSGAYGPRHVGKIPERTPDGKPSRAFLEKELHEAVERQNYRKAARIRKMLDEMDGGQK